MFRSANVVVNRQPVFGFVRSESSITIARIGKAQKIPAAACKSVHCISFTLGFAAALRAGRVYELLRASQRAPAITTWFEAVEFRQQHRQLFFRHRLYA